MAYRDNDWIPYPFEATFANDTSRIALYATDVADGTAGLAIPIVMYYRSMMRG
jgi:hypothetical protein